MLKKSYNTNIIIYFQMSVNNILITITDINGNTLDWLTSGRLEFKGRQKTSSSAVYTISLAVIKRLISKKRIFASVIFKGNPRYRYIFIKNLINIQNLKIISITEKTPIPHSGCRLPKKRRL